MTISLATEKNEAAIAARAEKAAAKAEVRVEVKAKAEAEAIERCAICAICAAFANEPGQEGECRRHAPVKNNEFPKMRDNGWCFEFVSLK